MSTIKADALTTKSDNTDLTITGHGSGVPNIEAGFKVGGSAGVPTASIQDDAITLAKMADDAVGVAQLSATGTASSSVFLRGDNAWAAAGGGKVGQIVSAQYTEYNTYASPGSWTDVNPDSAFTVTITPAATSSKILVLSTSNWGAVTYGHIRLVRDSTVIGVGTSVGSRLATSSNALYCFDNEHVTHAAPIMWMDSPSSTSALVYKLQIIDDHSEGLMRLNGSTDNVDAVYSGVPVSTIHCLEITA